jgi:hypothetical protein
LTHHHDNSVEIVLALREPTVGTEAMTTIRIALVSAFALGVLIAGGSQAHPQHAAPAHVAAIFRPLVMPEGCCD